VKAAALDLGTNTFLCLIVEGDKDGIRKIIKDEVEVVRLGQDVDRSGEFHPDALQRAAECLKRFRKMIDEIAVDRILGVATSAARDVRNGSELFKIAYELDLPLEIISGEDEARTSYAGVCSDMKDDRHRLVVDIGGGSTELILGRGRELLFSRSVDMGAVRLTERLIPTQPVPTPDRRRLDEFISEELRAPIAEISKHHVSEILAVAGTPTAIAAIELGGFDPAKVDGYFISREKLRSWCDDFASSSVQEKKQKYGLGGRADIIFVGASILLAVVENLKQPGFKVSVKGLRYGVALDLLSRS
jgi:exopolyphosphatase/guanosine-5'-triphosphate,3'-diphosphate pyrophosphatase